MNAGTREEYVERLKAKLDEWNAELAKLEAESDKARQQLSEQFKAQLEEARKRRDETQQYLTQLQKANEAAWQDMADGAEQAWQAFSEAFKRARSRFDS